MPHLVEKAPFYVSYRMQKNTYRREIKTVYVYVLDGIATAIGEVGIIEIEIVYNMYRVKPVVVSEPSQLCHAWNL
jgi:hypothetical protein